MTKRRRPLRELEVLDEIVSFQGVVVPCWRCKRPLTTEDIRSKNVQNEHLVEHGLDGEDEPINRRFSHAECHKIVTFGNGATTAGSSIGRIAKVKRIERTQKFIVRKEAPAEPTKDHGGAVASQSPRRQWGSGRKIQSAGFQRTKPRIKQLHEDTQ